MSESRRCGGTQAGGVGFVGVSSEAAPDPLCTLPFRFEICAEMLSGTSDPERETKLDEDAASAFAAFDFGPGLPGVDAPIDERRDSAADPAPDAPSPSADIADPGSPFGPWAAAAAAACAVANSLSFSPTHVCTNHRPPAMPRIPRFTCRHLRTFFPLLSSVMRGAKPVPIFGGGWTWNGLEGRG